MTETRYTVDPFTNRIVEIVGDVKPKQVNVTMGHSALKHRTRLTLSHWQRLPTTPKLAALWHAQNCRADFNVAKASLEHAEALLAATE